MVIGFFNGLLINFYKMKYYLTYQSCPLPKRLICETFGSRLLSRHDDRSTRCQSFLNSVCTYPLPLCTPPLPSKSMLYFRPSSLSFNTNNIDSGVGRFTAFKQNEKKNKQNEVVDGSTSFRQVCQLLLFLIAGYRAKRPVGTGCSKQLSHI